MRKREKERERERERERGSVVRKESRRSERGGGKANKKERSAFVQPEMEGR